MLLDFAAGAGNPFGRVGVLEELLVQLGAELFAEFPVVADQDVDGPAQFIVTSAEVGEPDRVVLNAGGNAELVHACEGTLADVVRRSECF